MATPDVQLAYERVDDSYVSRDDGSVDSALRRRLATSLSYNLQDQTKIPAGSVVGNKSNNSAVITSLSEGEKVVFVGIQNASQLLAASEKVGTKGKVIEVRDESSEKRVNLVAPNIESLHCKASEISVPTGSIDCVVADCTSESILKEDKRSVIQELHRILRSCGRLAISDCLMLAASPRDKIVPAVVEAREMEKYLVEIGFDDALLVDTKSSVGRSTDDPAVPNKLISSFEIFGHKSCGKNKGPRQVCRMDQQQPGCCAGGGC